MANKFNELHYHRGKALMIAGFVILLAGLLRLYNVDWSVVMIVIGAVLLLKGIMIKAMKK